MDEQTWLESIDSAAMLEFVWHWDQLSERKLWWFRVICCSRILRLANDESAREAVRVAEAIAEREEEETRLEDIVHGIARGGHDATQAAARQACSALLEWNADLHALRAGLNNAVLSIGYEVGYRGPGDATWGRPRQEAMQREREVHAALFREIVGNPFQEISIDQEWFSFRNGLVRTMAAMIYSDRRFEDMPILADALEDAGCDSADILNHLRGPGTHVRGCWALDLILGKE